MAENLAYRRLTARHCGNIDTVSANLMKKKLAKMPFFACDPFRETLQSRLVFF
jgi:hypothetical protein